LDTYIVRMILIIFHCILEVNLNKANKMTEKKVVKEEEEEEEKEEEEEDEDDDSDPDSPLKLRYDDQCHDHATG
jgi:hypothetical protein